ncbi:MAG: tetratricopeptide repeat protein [Bacteroidaceae bacterium]|nr:tetratricopeptide repeat protein [Prevotellaceae bacterium]MDY5632234.1 tetratricopeptide repeat protein [Bacteroidaceae bacterium]
MIKKLAFYGAMAAFALPAFAQYEKLDDGQTDLTVDENRWAASYIGSEPSQDPAKLVSGYITMLQMTYNSQQWGDMYENVNWLRKNAPIATVALYARGPQMLGNLIKSDTVSAENKKKYLNDMMSLFDERLKYLKYLNAGVPEGKKGRATEGDVLISKANYYHIYGYGVDADYTYNKIYDMYKAGINKIKEEGGREVKGAYIQYFFSVSHELYKVDNEFFREQFLNDYLESKEVCEKMLQLAKEETDEYTAQKIVDEYDKPLAVIEQVFAQSGAANREQLIAMYTPKVEENKNNIAYLRSAMNVLANNECDDTDVYYAAARYAHAIEPTYESAIGMAQYSKKEGKMQAMLTYYNAALDMATSDNARGRICMNIATSLINGKQYTGALVYLDRAVNYNAELKGNAALKKAVVYTSLGQYDKALAQCNEASSADITVSGSANRLAQKIRDHQANAAANARARAAYDAYIAKQKAEEDFWSKK